MKKYKGSGLSTASPKKTCPELILFKAVETIPANPQHPKIVRRGILDQDQMSIQPYKSVSNRVSSL